ENWHEVKAPIGRVEDSAILRCVREDGKEAITHYQVLAVKEGYSFLKLKLDTGRTHQIRVHMNHIGHPLPGDYLYHPVYDRVSRVPLHSYSLEFLHPITFEPMKFVAEVPKDMMLS
nr:RluA family pseudouridine synthase [Lachnospiraceae bacterium]